MKKPDPTRVLPWAAEPTSRRTGSPNPLEHQLKEPSEVRDRLSSNVELLTLVPSVTIAPETTESRYRLSHRVSREPDLARTMPLSSVLGRNRPACRGGPNVPGSSTSCRRPRCSRRWPAGTFTLPRPALAALGAGDASPRIGHSERRLRQEDMIPLTSARGA
jgi:hypothetical protein